MSEYGEGDDTLDESTAAAAASNSANNSIIGKVRTGVTSILPNSLSKWFSPSTNKTESSTNANKRRHNDSAEDAAGTPILPQRRILVNNYEDDDDDVEGDDLEDEHGGRTNAAILTSYVQARRSLNTSLNDEPPPLKRSRMTFDGSMLNSRPLVASTPAVSVQRTTSANHYSRLNLPAMRSSNKRETGYNFINTSATGFERGNANTDIIDLLIPISSGSNELMPETNNNELTQVEPACSRRNLNIPQTTTALTYNSSGGSSMLSTLRRQSLSSVKQNVANRHPTENNNILSSNIKDASSSLNPGLELDDVLSYNGQVQSKFQNGSEDVFTEEAEYRQSSQPTDSDIEEEENDTITELPMKRARHLAAGALRTDSTASKQRQQQQQLQKQHQTTSSTGLFNTSLSSSVNNGSRNGSRTSSFGNGLNFDTHLEGRKSLFAGGGGRSTVKNPLGNSTLSLNSLSRRQFNASIYGSTSALSDSRLLNATTSPFYKGNTTYGGAAAYRKYPTTARLTPTMMRPLSSLSTLSSSNNSLAGERTTAAAAGGSGGGASSAPVLSGSAKFIFDALNEMTTPLLDAKKMASSLQQRQQALKATELHNASAGVIRLQQVAKPYMRPTVMLRPKHTLNAAAAQQSVPPPPIRELQVPSMSQLLTMKKQFQNSTERSRQIAMQKATNQTYAIQTSTATATTPLSSSTSTTISTTTTAAATKTTTQPITSSTGFSLPASTTFSPLSGDVASNVQKSTPFSSEAVHEVDLKQQQKHVNKIRHKINNTRNTLDCVENEPSLLPADLPQILFPAMKEMPKIDFGIPPTTTPATGSAASTASSLPKIVSPPITTTKAMSNDVSLSSNLNVGFKFSPPARLTDAPPLSTTTTSLVPASMNFKFCDPVSLASTTKNLDKNEASFLPPMTNKAAVLPPSLKTGSCLDALKPKPVETVALSSSPPTSNFGDQFKKASGEWECDACMVRNKSTAQKCVACETPQKSKAPSTFATIASMPTAAPVSVPTGSSGFGNLFKKQAGEWECDACMLRNKPDAAKCVSCETARKTQNASAAATPASSFNAATVTDTDFKAIVAAQKSSSWECDSCMTRNDATRLKCACCEQAKPGSVATAKSITTPTFAAPKADDDFKAIAAKQAAAKWECEACMTRNESTRMKCACCEQAKPGSESTQQQSESTAPKFSFGTTAAAKFSFGFGAGNESELRAKTTTTTTSIFGASNAMSASIAKTEGTTATTGFTFGAKPAQMTATTTTTTETNKGFSFGIPTTTTPAATADKDAADGATKPKSFTFGLGSAAVTATTSATTAATISTIGEATKATSASSSTTTTTTASIAPYSFGIPNAIKVASSTSTTTTNAANMSNPLALGNTKPAAFSFGLTPQTQKTTESSSATTTSTAAATTAATTTASSTVVAANTTNTFGGQQAFSFGLKPPEPTSATTTTAAATLPSFSLATNTKPLLTFGVTTTTTSSSSSTTTTNTGFGSSSGFNFAAPAKPIFGLTTTTTTSNATAPTTTSAVGATTFGAFGSPKLTNSQKENANSSTIPSTPFGGFNFGDTPKATENNLTTTTNLFGVNQAATQNSQSKPIASATQIFGNTASAGAANSASQNATTTSTPMSPAVAGAVNPAWPNSAASLFGGLAKTQETAPKAVFGNFGNSNTGSSLALSNANAAPSTSLFGNAGSAATPVFGSSNNNVATVTAFGLPSAASSSNNNNSIPSSTPNLFGSSSNNNLGNTNAAASMTQFGSGNPAPPPAFGSSSGTFGSFGSAATGQQQQPQANTNAQSNATTPFQFGAQTTNSGGFNFGANAAPARPAFNFTANNQQPSFNFTGSSTESNQNASRPFQFGAPAAPVATPAFGNPPTASTSAMVFNFSGAQTSTEGTSAPFQFSAGNPTQPTNNIFAPSASNAAQSSAAARRRVRVPTRRLTPR